MIEKNHVGLRLRMARAEAKLTLEQVAAMMGVSAQSVHNWEAGKNWPTKDKLSRLAEILGKDVQWVLTGFSAVSRSDGEHFAPPGQFTGRLIVRVSMKRAVQESPWSASGAERITTHFPCGSAAFAVLVDDKANAPMLEPGDSVVIDPDITPIPGDLVLVRTQDGRGALRKLRPRHDGQIDLVPVNPDWATQTIAESTVKVIGTMSERAHQRR